MDTLRKWLNKPKADDKSLLARFYHADRALTAVASELDSFDGRAEPDRCSRLVSRLRQGQDKVLSITNRIMEELLSEDRAPRAFRAKFPEEVLQENLAGQLWFGAECLAAGSSIMNRELESTAMRPLAQAVTKSLDNVRNLLRDQCLRNNIPNSPILKLDINDSATEQLYESLKIFDRLFAEFELRYVSAMVQVKSKHEYEMQELICVLFSETLQRALTTGLLEQDQVDSFDPALMFSIPRLAIITGLVVYRKGPLNMDMPADQLSEMFRPFRTILIKIRELLRTLNKNELYQLERLLCTNEEIQLKLGENVENSNSNNNNNNNNSSNPSQTETNRLTENENTANKCSVVENTEICDDNNDNDIDEINIKSNRADELVVSNNGDNNCSTSSSSSNSNSSSSKNICNNVEESLTTEKLEAQTIDSSKRKHRHCKRLRNSSESTKTKNDNETNEYVADVDDDDYQNDVRVENFAGTSPGTISTSSATTADISSDWTDEDQINKDLSKDQLVTADCATGFLIPNTNFGNLLQPNDDPLTDQFVASDDEFSGGCGVGCTGGINSENIPIKRDNNSVNNIVNNNNIDSGISTTENTSSDRTPDSDNKNDDLHNENSIRSRLCSNSSSPSSYNNSLISSPKTSQFVGEGQVLNSTTKHDSPASCSRMDTAGDSSEELELPSAISIPKSEKSSSTETTPTNKMNTSRRSSSMKISQRHTNHHSHSHSTSTTNREHRHHSKKRSKHLHTSVADASSVDTTSSSSLSDGDPHEVNLALRAAGRMKFKKTENLLHRLFVCIAGVADQLQTNFASDLRQILRSVFLMNTSPVQTEEIKLPEKKDSSDLFEFRASENDVIQENNGGSNQSIYSAEEVNPELDNVFTSGQHPLAPTVANNNNNNSSSHSIVQQRGNSVDSSAVQSQSTAGTTNNTGSRNNTTRSRSLGEEQDDDRTTRKIQLLQERRRLSSQGSNSAGSNSPVNSSASNSPINERSSRTNSISNSNSHYHHHVDDDDDVDVDVDEDENDEDDTNSAQPTTTSLNNSNLSLVSGTASSPPINVNSSTTNRNQNNNNASSRRSLTNNHNRCMPKPSPPAWIPDDEAPRCMACTTSFTAFRRRHHCRNCGGVFCGGCSNSSAPLPKYGLTKAVRVCRDCYHREVVCST